MGFTVVEAARGEEALSLARVTWFDAVLLDVDMPGMGGVEACRGIRRAVARLPILMYREFPRLCRGGSSSLTFPGVHPETLRGEPPSTHQGETGWTSMKA